MNKNVFNTLILILAFLILSSCTNMRTPQPSSKSLLSAEEYLQLAATAENDNKQKYLLNAANRFVQNHEIKAAQQTLNQMAGAALPSELLVKKQLLQANIFILTSQFNRSIPLLQNLAAMDAQLPNKEKIEVTKLLAYAYQKTGNIVKSIQERSQILNLLPNQNAKIQCLQTILQNLQQLDTQSLSQLLNQNSAPYLRGWFSLALISNNANQNPNQLAMHINQWRSLYPKHPANLLLPKRVKQPDHLTMTEPKNIALLLPLHGKLAQAAHAIRNGFFAAYYQSKQNKSNLPNIMVLDTSHKNIVDVYHQAIAQGANFIVGPLTKSNVEALAKMGDIRVPTLALNTIEEKDAQEIKNLFQFGLSPVDEAQQVAIKAWGNHFSHAIIIAPNNTWGKNIAKTFSQTWENEGGQIVDSLYYHPQTQTIASNIRHLLNIGLSEKQSHQLRNILHKKFRFVPRRRKDVDVIFLVARPTIARQIKPLLKYYYAGNLPVFSISKIYAGIPNPYHDRDLNGIIFCDMPWVLTARQMPSKELDSLQKNVASIWANSYLHYPKLYALGVDAYDVIPNLTQLAMLPQFGIKAATGILFLKHQHLYRKLLWSRIKNGQPRLIQ